MKPNTWYIVQVEDFDPKDERHTIITYEQDFDNLEDAQEDFERLSDMGQEPEIISMGYDEGEE